MTTASIHGKTNSAGTTTAKLARKAEPGFGGSTANTLLDRGFRYLSARPFWVRRQALKALLTIAGRLPAAKPPKELVTACSRTLSLSAKASRAFLWRTVIFDALSQMEWLALAHRAKPGLVRDARHISLAQEREIEWLSRQRGAILGTMHFGPYALSLVWMFYRYFAGRTVIIAKTPTNDPDEQAAIARLAELGVDLRFAAPTSQQQLYDLARLVRRGAIAILMVDLPPQYGRSSPVDTLGHTLHFTGGAADLAAMCGVPLALFRARSDVTGDILEVVDIFEVRRGDERARADAVERIHRFITRTILSWPEQWHMWMRFKEYHSPEKAA